MILPKFLDSPKHVFIRSNVLFSQKNVIPHSFQPFRGILNEILIFRKIEENYDFPFSPPLKPILICLIFEVGFYPFKYIVFTKVCNST